MTEKTKTMDFSKVYGAAFMTAYEQIFEGANETERNQLSWLYWDVLWKKQLTHAGRIETLSQWGDTQTLWKLNNSLLNFLYGALGGETAGLKVIGRKDLERINSLLLTAHKLAQ